MNWLPSSDDRRELLTELLDQAGLAYALAQNPRGSWYARFAMETREGDSVVVTAMVQTLVLRLTAHAVLDDGELPPQAINALNRNWGFGRFDGTDATVSLYLGGRAPIGPLIRSLVEHISDAGVVVRSGRAPMFQLSGGVGLSRAALSCCLQEADIESIEREGLFAARFPSRGGPDVIAEFFNVGGSILAIRAQHPTGHRYDSTSVPAMVARYNRDLSFGALHIWDDGRLFWYAEVLVSETGLDADLLNWLVDKAVFVLDQLHKDCGLPDESAPQALERAR